MARTVSRLVPILLAGAIIATLSGGVTLAATASSGAKACVNSKRVLALLTKKGTCPAHYIKTTIGAQGSKGVPGQRGPKGNKGDQGKPGPGAITTSLDEPLPISTYYGPTVETGVPGLTVVPYCVAQSAVVFVEGTGAIVIRGSATATNHTAHDTEVYVAGGGPYQDLNNGGNDVYFANTVTSGQTLGLLAEVDSDNSSSTANGTFIVSQGSSYFTLQASVSASTTVCHATATVIPTTTAS